MRRRPFLFAVLALALAAGAAPVRAHHGLTLWDEDTETVVEGFISHELTGFPHWEIKIRGADGDDWRIDLGNSFEMERAGMSEDAAELPIGKEVRVEGNRPLNSETRLVRPKRIIVGDKVYEFRGSWN